MTSEATKWCPGCKELKTVGAFAKNCRRPDGRQDHCKACRRDIQIAYRRTPVGHQALQRDYAKDRDRRLQRTFGITLDTFNQLAAEQKGRCCICHTIPSPKRGLVVDHCHTTGVVRGLICGPCNSAVGMLRDCPENVAAVLVYLAAHGRKLGPVILRDFLRAYPVRPPRNPRRRLHHSP